MTAQNKEAKRSIATAFGQRASLDACSTAATLPFAGRRQYFSDHAQGDVFRYSYDPSSQLASRDPELRRYRIDRNTQAPRTAHPIYIPRSRPPRRSSPLPGARGTTRGHPARRPGTRRARRRAF
jgi:hypothetical protein